MATTPNLFFLSFVLVLICVLSGCNSQKNSSSLTEINNAPDTPRPPDAPGTENPTPGVSDPLACYLNACFPTASISPIARENDDYEYLGEENYPDRSLQKFYRGPERVLDLNSIPENTKLSPSFKISEFMSPDKGRYGLFSTHVVSQLQFLRNSINRVIKINSGYRSPGYNSSISGSATWSRHTYGDAVDMKVPGVRLSDLPAMCESFGASFTLVYTTHVHCDWRYSRQDPAFYDSTDTTLDAKFAFKPADLYSAQSQLIVENDGQQKTLFADVYINEEIEGELTYLWTVTAPSGLNIVSEASSIAIPNPSGTYHVKLVVGGSIVIEQTFVW